jgi:putative DNA primase/helicase
MSSCSELLAERGPQADEEVSLAPGRQFDGCEVNDGSGLDRIVEIERLASLDSLDYEVAREAAAKRLGIRTSALDKEVKAKRQALGLDKDHASDDGQGRPVQIVDVLPWHTAVDGDMLAAALSGAIRNYVVLPDTSADAIALWVMHSWMVDAFTVSPRLAVYSPTKGCGKTTLLGVVSKLVKRPKFTGSISPAALFRLVETFQPTLLIDELKKFLELGSELHGILNEGHGRGVHVLRVLGEKKELREFRVFGAVAFGTLGRVPDDLEDRSIIVRLQRRRAEEEVCEFRPDRAENLEQLARWCARWAEDNARHIEVR